jgi:hypothetical protein
VFGGEKSTEVPRRTSHSWQFYLNRFAPRKQLETSVALVRRSRGDSRAGLIAGEPAGRSLWLLGAPKK